MAKTTTKPKRKTTARRAAPAATKAASEPLLEPATYAKRSIDRLKQERTTINNRLSGLGTQVKRHLAKHDPDKARAAEDRILELQTRRQQLNEAIEAKAAGKTSTSAHGARRGATRRGR